MSSSPVIRVAAGLLFRAGRLLIAQRLPDSHLGGLWEFPGGKLETGETHAECLVRELREELDVEVEALEQIAEARHAYPEKSVEIVFLRCRWLKNEPRPVQCANIAWVGRDELDRFPFPPADAGILDVLTRNERLWRSGPAGR
ncbi:MAG: (deoxy)nucleoside triphosphate pyrophosphohydrolase [Verrucomicrobia bacterium]|nr:(deoxy)nucleoside triphosphate pyrophosphohydrolase [Verrucomicrobiota bacterium]MBI3868580.1 (deoxy)nucleoside triphosphate pyrophosphohydrolase [Verrucomicrobiota bacterium]